MWQEKLLRCSRMMGPRFMSARGSSVTLKNWWSRLAGWNLTSPPQKRKFENFKIKHIRICMFREVIAIVGLQ
jgi:hypothetical protein